MTTPNETAARTPHLLIIRGLPGSGKSTLARSLDRFHVEADQFMHENGTYRFNADRLPECHAACLEAVHTALAEGRDVVVSNTFTRRWEVMPYINLGYPFSVVVCEGRYGNIHGVPDSKVREMADRWEWF